MKDRTIEQKMYVGYMAALGAATFYGSAALVVSKIVSEFAPLLVGTAFSLLFGTMIIGVLFHRHVVSDYRHIPWRGWLFILLSCCAATWGMSFWFLSLNDAPIVLTAPLVSTTTLITLLITHIFFQRLERVTLRTVVGAITVVVGVGLITFRANY